MGHMIARRAHCGVPSHTPRQAHIQGALRVGCQVSGALGRDWGELMPRAQWQVLGQSCRGVLGVWAAHR